MDQRAGTVDFRAPDRVGNGRHEALKLVLAQSSRQGLRELLQFIDMGRSSWQRQAVKTGHLFRKRGECAHRAHDRAEREQRERDCQQDRRDPEQGDEVAACLEPRLNARQVALQPSTLAVGQGLKQAQHLFGARLHLGPIEVAIAVRALPCDDGDDLQGESADLGAPCRNFVDLFALRGNERVAAGIDVAPLRRVDGKLRAVGVLEVDFAGCGVGHEVGDHGVERRLECEQVLQEVTPA